MTLEETTSVVIGLAQTFFESGRITQEEADDIDRKVTEFILKQKEMPQAIDEHVEELF